jgi:PadR family transcriptional regulator AphA
MATSGLNFRVFILGLLTNRSMSGYGIRRFLRSLGWLLGNPSFGTIYPALHALLEDGLATVEVVPHPTRPARKIYTITQSGQQALQEWIEQPVPNQAGLRAFIMHLILTGNGRSDALSAHLQQRRDAVLAHRTSLKQATEALGNQASAGEALAIEYGLAIADAELAWLESRLTPLLPERNSDTPDTAPS